MRYVKLNEAIISDQEIRETADDLVQTYVDESNLTITYIGEIRKVLPRPRLLSSIRQRLSINSSFCRS